MHYIPAAALLAGFTDTGTKEGALRVLELKSGKERTVSAEREGGENHLYRADDSAELRNAGFDPFFIERFFAEWIDGPSAKVVEEARVRNAMPDDGLRILISLMAAVTVRTPARMAWIKRHYDKMFRATYDIAKEQGLFPPSGDPAVDELLERYPPKIGVKRNFVLREMIRLSEEIEGHLCCRTWSLVRAPDDSPDFVISDSPLVLDWKDAACKLPAGFLHLDTIAFLPLGSRIGLLGLFPPATPPPMTRQLVAVLNGRSLRAASQRIYYRSSWEMLPASWPSGASH